MFSRLFGKFSKDLAIDLGTKNTLVYTEEKGIIINEPSIVVVNARTEEILAVGEDAEKMVGKTPGHVRSINPLVDGVIFDFEVTEKMIKHFINKVHSDSFTITPRPKMIIGIPLDITEVEKKAVEDSAKSAGARKVHLIEQSMAAAIGARLPVSEAMASMIVDIGGGTSEIAVISLSGVVTSKSLRLAGDVFDNNIIEYMREEFNILIGTQMAQDIKIKVGSATPLKDVLEMEVRGRDLLNGLPRAVTVTDAQIREALRKSINLIIDNVKTTLEKTPPELVADIYEQGIYLSGGGALIRGLDKELAEATKISVRIVDDPLTAVVRGTGVLLNDFELLEKILAPGEGEEL